MTSILENYNIDNIKETIVSQELEVQSLVSIFERLYADILVILKSQPIHEDNELEQFHKRYEEYNWTEDAKQFSVLMRDIVFSRYKDIQLIQDGIVDTHLFNRHRREEAEIFEVAFKEVYKKFQNIKKIKVVDEEMIKSWKHLISPLPVIAEQILKLRDQADSLIDATIVLNSLREEIKLNIENIKKNFVQLNLSCSSLNENITVARQFLQGFIEKESFDKLGATIVDFEKVYKKIEISRPDAPYFHFESDTRKTFEIPVSTIEGSLKVKEINFSEQINNWIETELYSRYQEEKILIDGLYDNTLLTLFNVKNRLSLFQSEEPKNFGSEHQSIMEPIVLLEKNLGITDEKIKVYSRDILAQLDEMLVVSEIFNKERVFLPVDHYSYLDIRKSKKWFNSLPFGAVQNWVTKYINLFFFKQPDAGNALSSTIEYTDNKKIPVTSDIKNSLFFSKGYLGQSFYIHRNSIEQKILDTYHYWQKGFGGSVLLHGTRLSGKTSILQALSDIIQEEKIVFIKPDETITYLGRKFEPNYNLKGVLEFLNKHSITNRVIVVIDDLELWRSPSTSFYENMIALQESIGKNGKRLFFIVTTNKWMKGHLDNHLNFSDQFIVRIPTNQMNTQKIITAIKIRHSATYQRSLLGDTNDDYDRVLVQKAKKTAISCNGNIGASLKEWGRNAVVAGEEFNLYTFKKMPDIVARHLIKHRLILTHLFRFRQSSEIELRTMIGDSFVRDINQRIQLLIGLGVLERKINGVFSINEMLINETEDLIFDQHGKLSQADE